MAPNFEADQLKKKEFSSYQTLTSTQEELRYPTLNGSKISHVRFGRMDRRFAEAQNERVIELIEGAIGKSLENLLKQNFLKVQMRLIWLDPVWKTR